MWHPSLSGKWIEILYLSCGSKYNHIYDCIVSICILLAFQPNIESLEEIVQALQKPRISGI